MAGMTSAAPGVGPADVGLNGGCLVLMVGEGSWAHHARLRLDEELGYRRSIVEVWQHRTMHGQTAETGMNGKYRVGP